MSLVHSRKARAQVKHQQFTFNMTYVKEIWMTFFIKFEITTNKHGHFIPGFFSTLISLRLRETQQVIFGLLYNLDNLEN